VNIDVITAVIYKRGEDMKTMVISEFKAKCIRVVKDVNRQKQPLLLTLRGIPVATVEPIRNQPGKRILGSMKGSVKISGDIVKTDFSGDWEINR
jgi:antitoxin (DNA-binding transcriptional repressor) of toxin-antitoxin stability system